MLHVWNKLRFPRVLFKFDSGNRVAYSTKQDLYLNRALVQLIFKVATVCQADIVRDHQIRANKGN